MDTKTALQLAGQHLKGRTGTTFDVLTLAKPADAVMAVNMAKIVSKLSPIIGNLIELSAVDLLNEGAFKAFGKWVRQDPDFPDALFVGKISPAPGLEIKAWFPLATEITARFKDSQKAFVDNNTDVALLAWLPEFLFFGRPKLVDVCVVSGGSVAASRDDHYHNPPDYLVIEPEDTSSRTRNLRQTNTSGYKFQGTPKEFASAEAVVKSWGKNGRNHSYTADYQAKLHRLMGTFKYRLDTNFAKMDRIEHEGIEAFKTQVLNQKYLGRKIREWAALFASEDNDQLGKAIKEVVGSLKS